MFGMSGRECFCFEVEVWRALMVANRLRTFRLCIRRRYRLIRLLHRLCTTHSEHNTVYAGQSRSRFTDSFTITTSYMMSPHMLYNHNKPPMELQKCLQLISSRLHHQPCFHHYCLQVTFAPSFHSCCHSQQRLCRLSPWQAWRFSPSWSL
jgi:hypothetical protein